MSMFASTDGMDDIPMCKLTRKNITEEAAAKVTVEVIYKLKNAVSDKPGLKTCSIR